MNKNTSYIILAVAAIVALVGVVSAISQSAKKKAALSEVRALQQQIVDMEAYVPDPSAEPEIIYLTQDGGTNEITTLKNQLAEKNAEIERLRTGGRQRGEDRGDRESWEERIARMKEEDPEGYAERVKQREEFQSRMRYNMAERTATFMDLDTSGMTPEELANHAELVEKMARVWELTDQFQDPEAAPDREAMRELFTMSRELRPLMDAERTYMFKQLGSDMGYEGEDAEAFATHVEDIIDATSMRMPGWGGRGGGGPRR